MTSQTAAPKTTAQAAFEAATQKTADAGGALNAAEEAIPAAEAALVAAEANLIDVLANASGESPNRAEIGKARTSVEKCRADIDWAGVQRKAAEQAYFRAVEAEVVARRAVIAEQYEAAHAAWHDPENRERVLRAQIESSIAEWITLSSDRRELHAVLEQEVAHFAPDERAKLPAGGLSSSRPSWYAPLQITLADDEIKAAVEAGIAAGKAAMDERDRAKRD